MPPRSAADLFAPFSRRFGLLGIVLFAAVLCDLVIVTTSAFDGIGPLSRELYLLPGIAGIAACALWAASRPAWAAVTGAAVLLLSTGLLRWTGTTAYTALLGDITFAETVAGVVLLYYVVRKLHPVVAVVVTGVLVGSTFLASMIRTDWWRNDEYVTTGFAGGVLLVLTTVAAVQQRSSRRQPHERNRLLVLIRQQLLLVAALATFLFLETFQAASTDLRGGLVLLCSLGTAVAALLVGRSTIRAAVYYSGLVVVAGGILKTTDFVYADFNGISPTAVVSGMAIVVFVVRYEPPKRAMWLIVLLSAAIAATVLLNLPFIAVAAIRMAFVLALLTLGICVAIGMFLRARDSERARTVASAVTDAQTAERMALARELHDVVAHHVTGIVVQAQAARMLAEQNPAVVVDSLGQIEKAGTDAMTAMRRLVRSMRGDAPAGASEFSEQATTDLAADLRRLVATGNHGVPTELHLDVPDTLAPEVARSALRLVQESLTNVGKHAAMASQAEVTVDTVDDQLRIRVANDEGAGQEQARAERTAEDSGYGLVGMRERVELLRGRLSAGPTSDGGWLVEAWVPLTATGETGGRAGE